MSPQMNADKHR